MENTKITYAQALTTIREFAIGAGYDNTDVLDKVQSAIDSYNKRNSTKSGKPTKNQTLNETIKTDILNVLATHGAMTATEISKALEGDYSVSKVSALLRQLKASDLVSREEIKRVPYYKAI